MANPQYPIVVPKGTIVKVASGIIEGNLRRKSFSTKYLSTYRESGQQPPSNIDEFSLMFDEFPNREAISSDQPIDVYVYCPNSDGLLRLDS